MVCSKCGCKLAAAGIACACFFVTVHPQSLCGQSERDVVLYCDKPAVEPVHVPDESPISTVRSNVLVVASTSSSSSTISGPFITWTAKDR
jgi:hypothetical protein